MKANQYPPLYVIDRLDTRKIARTTLPKGFAKRHLELLRKVNSGNKKARSEKNGQTKG